MVLALQMFWLRKEEKEVILKNYCTRYYMTNIQCVCAGQFLSRVSL